MLPLIPRAGKWLVQSGIQEPNGGVARYYRADSNRNLPVSTEITGYAVSTLVYLHSLTGEEQYLERARAGACFLTQLYRNCGQSAMPFEAGSGETYFFDCGIIVRGLLAAWRATGEEHFLDSAVCLGKQMAVDFLSPHADFHPVLRLPEKSATPRDALRWSQSAGCYQLKSAMAWWDLAEATGDAAFREPYERVLEYSLLTHCQFLPGHPDPLKVMDRLHAYCYFLEGMLACAADSRCAAIFPDGIQRVAHYLNQISPEFERSDVLAQLLRVRLYAGSLGVAPLDTVAAEREASRLAEFQAASDDPRIDGGFYFGRRQGAWLPHINPVSTGFALQALALWDQVRSSTPCPPQRNLLV